MSDVDPHAVVVSELRTCQQVAELFGVTVGRVRQLVQARGVGRKLGREIVLTPAEVEVLRPGPTGRPKSGPKSP